MIIWLFFDTVKELLHSQPEQYRCCMCCMVCPQSKVLQMYSPLPLIGQFKTRLLSPIYARSRPGATGQAGQAMLFLVATGDLQREQPSFKFEQLYQCINEKPLIKLLIVKLTYWKSSGAYIIGRNLKEGFRQQNEDYCACAIINYVRTLVHSQLASFPLIPRPFPVVEKRPGPLLTHAYRIP